MTLKRVTCNSFPWNKAGDFRTILCPNMDKSKSCTRGKMRELRYIHIRKFLNSKGLFWKALNNNDHNQVFWARETEHLQETIVLTKTAGQLLAFLLLFSPPTWPPWRHAQSKNSLDWSANLLKWVWSHGALSIKLRWFFILKENKLLWSKFS